MTDNQIASQELIAVALNSDNFSAFDLAIRGARYLDSTVDYGQLYNQWLNKSLENQKNERKGLL